MNQQQYDELDDLFAGSGSPSFKFEKVGDRVEGIIDTAEARQQRDFDSGEAKTWDDGKPMMELVLTLITDLRDPSIEDDDGSRRVFVRGQMLTALRQAVRKAKARKPERGAIVTITHSGLGEAKRKGFNPPKLYTVDYVPSNAAAVAEMFGDDDTTPAPAPAAAPAAAATQEDLIAKASQLDPAALAELLAGISK